MHNMAHMADSHCGNAAPNCIIQNTETLQPSELSLKLRN